MAFTKKSDKPAPEPEPFDPVREFEGISDETLALLERRLLDPDEPGSVPIRLKDEPVGAPRRWYLRWVNTSIPQRYHTLTQAHGYVPVRWDDLATRDDIADRHEASEFVARGEKGVERLMKMPWTYYDRIKRAQAERREAKNTARQLKADLQASAVAAASSDPDKYRVSPDEAAHYAGSLVGDITVGRERLVGGE